MLWRNRRLVSNLAPRFFPIKSIAQYQSLIRGVGQLLLFQIGWFCCVIGGDAVAVPATTLILSIHAVFFVENQREWLLIAGVAAIGWFVDSGLTYFSVLEFNVQPILQIPIWLICLWLLFATTLNHSLRWLSHHPLLAPIIAAVCGPLSYLGGSALAGVKIAEPLWQSLLLLAVSWASVIVLSFCWRNVLRLNLD